MSHPSQISFIQSIASVAPDFFRDKKVLEFGSLDINGSVRQFFSNCEYIGIDVEAGKGVDIVCQAQDFDAPDNSFDVVISCECMEHNPHWKETFLNMIRVCKGAGLVIMSCATVGRREHGTARSNPDASPLTVGMGWDYYKNISNKVWLKAFPLEESFSGWSTWTNWESSDLYFVGIKKGRDEKEPDDKWRKIRAGVDKYVRKVNGRARILVRRLFGALFGDFGFLAIIKFRKLIGA